MKKLSITKGKFKTMPAFCEVFGLKVWEVSNEDEWIAQIRGNESEIEYNAKLTANAFNTAQKTGLFPSELLERYNEAIEVLEEANKDLIVLHGNIYQELKKGNSQWEGVDEIIYKRIEANKQTISKAKEE